jgi:hypothetical protein
MSAQDMLEPADPEVRQEMSAIIKQIDTPLLAVRLWKAYQRVLS